VIPLGLVEGRHYGIVSLAERVELSFEAFYSGERRLPAGRDSNTKLAVWNGGQ